MSRTPERVYLGLGSNVGVRAAQLARAVRALEEHQDVRLNDITQSSIYETAALLPKDAPPEWNVPFFNQVISGYTLLSPEQLLTAIKSIELELGRQDRGHWGPREIDIDIISMGDRTIMSAHLTVPHAEMTSRAFVLVPLAEIAPEWVHPYDQKTVHELWLALPPESRTLKKIA